MDEIAGSRPTPEIVVGKKDAIVRALIDEFVSQADIAISARGRFVIALSGGSIATECYPALARLAFDWTKAEFFWADERAVPAAHPDSNYRAGRLTWLDAAHVPPLNIHRMEADRPELERAAADYQAQLVAAAGSPPRLDLALLGIGPDGHVASIFPRDAASDDADAVVAVVRHAPKPPPVRLTLTMKVLCAVRRPLLIAFGSEKAQAVRDALTESSTTPAARLVRGSASLKLLLDEEAAGLLPDNVE